MGIVSGTAAYVLLAALIVVGSAALAYQAYAQNASAPTAPAATPAYKGSNSWQNASYANGCDHEEQKEVKAEYKHEYKYENRKGFNLTPINVTGTVVEAIPAKNLLVVQTGSNTNVTIKVLPVYVDNSTGYFVSGHWIVVKVADALANNETVTLSAQGVLVNGKSVGVAQSLDVLGKNLYAPGKYLHELNDED